MTATIWHNPRCSKSRETLARLQAAGSRVEIVDYLKQPPDRDALAAMLREAGVLPRAALRKDAPKVADDAAAFDLMLDDPATIERPFVRTAKGARLCRPPERVDEIL